MSEPDPKRQMAELEAKLAAHRVATAGDKAHQEEHYSQAQHAWRMVTEMVAGLGLGFGIGYGLDALFGTQPFLMVLFTLLGLAAGINVMIRTANELQKNQIAHQAGQTDDAGKAEKPSQGTKRADNGD